MSISELFGLVGGEIDPQEEWFVMIFQSDLEKRIPIMS